MPSNALLILTKTPRIFPLLMLFLLPHASLNSTHSAPPPHITQWTLLTTPIEELPFLEYDIIHNPSTPNVNPNLMAISTPIRNC